jgi:hypothetical protein
VEGPGSATDRARLVGMAMSGDVARPSSESSESENGECGKILDRRRAVCVGTVVPNL